jgi:hypothetical protein
MHTHAQTRTRARAHTHRFYDTWGGGQSAYVLATHTIEKVCKSRARDFHRACGNTFEPAVQALFLPTGKTFLFPGDQGGCLINNTACGKDANYIGTNVYDLGGGDMSDRDPVACQRRAVDFYGGCGMNAFNATTVVTSRSLPTGAAASFPGTAGGCVVSNNKCPNKPTEQKTFWDSWDNDRRALARARTHARTHARTPTYTHTHTHTHTHAHTHTHTHTHTQTYAHRSGSVESMCLARSFDYFSYCHVAVAFGGEYSRPQIARTRPLRTRAHALTRTSCAHART